QTWAVPLRELQSGAINILREGVLGGDQHENLAVAALEVFCDAHGAGVRLSRSDSIPGQAARIFKTVGGGRAHRAAPRWRFVPCARVDQYQGDSKQSRLGLAVLG